MDVDRLTPAERREALQAYLDGELAPDDARRVAAWLAVHTEARSGVEGLRRLNDLLGAYEDEPVPEGFAARVTAAVLGAHAGEGRGGSPAHASWLRVPRWVPLAAAAVLLVALGLGVLLGSRRSSPTAPPAQETALALEACPVGSLFLPRTFWRRA